jgi:hypothetical protein
VAVMDTLHLKKANISLIMAMKIPERVNSVCAFGANMNTDAIVPGAFTSPKYTTKELAVIKVSKIAIAEGDHTACPWFKVSNEGLRLDFIEGKGVASLLGAKLATNVSRRFTVE